MADLLPTVSEPFAQQLRDDAAKLAKRLAVALRLSTGVQANLAALLFYFYLDNKAWGDKRHLAYALATVKAETGDFTPKSERRANPKLNERNQKIWFAQNAYWDSGYFGRGLVQVTWEGNYRKIGKKIGVDLVANPDALLELKLSYLALRIGMAEGVYTGKKLSDYFNDRETDWVNARRIINGLDRAEEIAEDAETIFQVLDVSK